MSRRHLFLLALLATLLLLPAASASAAGFLVSGGPGSYQYIGGDEGSTIVVASGDFGDGPVLVFNDDHGLTNNDGDCVPIDANSAACDASFGNTQASVEGKGGNDTIIASSVEPRVFVGADGGTGVDSFVGHDGTDSALFQDDNAESVDCRGSSDDQATLDADDTSTGCESEVRAAPRLTMAAASANEGQAVTFTLHLNAPAPAGFTVGYAVTNGTTANADFSPSGTPSGTVTFASGDQQQTITVPTNDDAELESSETFTLTLSNPQPASAVTLSNSTATGTVRDNDGSTPVVSITDAPHVTEGSDAMFAVTLNAPSASTVTVGYQVQSGTASTSDYTDPPMSGGTVTFAPGETTQTVTIATTDDAVDENDQQTFTVTLTNPNHATLDGSATTATGTILDNDALPQVALTGGSATEGGPVTFTVTKTGATERTVRVAYITNAGTATSNSDYPLTGAFVDMLPADATKTFTIAATDDDVDENDETFSVSITDASNASVASGGATATGTILDGDPPAVLSISGGTAVEGNAVTFTVTKTPSEKTVTVAYETSDGTAHQPGDYTSTSGTLTFAPGAPTQTFTVPTSDDSTEEDSQTVLATLSSPTEATISPTHGTGTGTIADDDTPPVLSITGNSATEGSVVTFTVTKTGATKRTSTVSYATGDGTAHSSGDYTSVTGTLTFAPAETTKTFTVDTSDDSVDEDDKTVLATLSSPTDATISASLGTGTATITDDDASPVLAITGGSAGEGGSVTFTVTKTGNPTERTATASYATSDGTAKAPGDYTARSGTVTLAPGDTSKTFDVQTADDSIDEDAETFTATLSAPVVATLGTATATGTINDNDPEVAVVSLTGGTATEGGPITFTATKTGATERTVTVDYATSDGTAHAPGDYTSRSGTLTFAPGETSKTFDVGTAGDALDEDDETFTAALTNPANATVGAGSATGTITDDDAPPALSVSDAGSANEGDSGTHPAVFKVSLSGPSAKAVTVDAATTGAGALADSDFDSFSGTLTFAPGETTKTVEVAVRGDTTDEDSEDFSLDLSNPRNATIAAGHGVAGIANDDALPLVVVSDERVTEGGTAAFSLVLTSPSGKAVSVHYRTVDGTASAPGDYQAVSGTASFAPGETLKNVPVTTVQDRAAEGDETFKLALDDPVGMDLRNTGGTATIADDEGHVKPTIAFSVAPARDRKAPFRYVLAGRVKPPKGTSAAACRADAFVTARVTRKPKSKLVATKRAMLSDKCTFRLKLSIAKRPGNGRLRVGLAYAGNDRLKAVKSKSRSLRAG